MKHLVRIFLLLPLVFFLFLCKESSQTQAKDITSFVSVTQAEWLDIAKTKPDHVILDVRTQEEHKEQSIPGSILVPLNELEARHGELSKDKTILIYCRSGSRSAVAADLLTAKGFKNLYNLKGGILSWR
jgi:phage shock protein E